jgi:hypothetical protein
MNNDVVIHDMMGDPAGYAITHDRTCRHVVTRLADGQEISRHDTRTDAVAACEADRFGQRD